MYPSPVFDPNGEVIDNVYFNPAVLPVTESDYDEVSWPVKGGNPDVVHSPVVAPNVYHDPNLHGAAAMAPPPDYDSSFPEKPKLKP